MFFECLFEQTTFTASGRVLAGKRDSRPGRDLDVIDLLSPGGGGRGHGRGGGVNKKLVVLPRSPGKMGGRPVQRERPVSQRF